jgi:elongation factor G
MTLLFVTVVPSHLEDHERLQRGVESLAAADPTIRVEADPESGRVVIHGIGELQLQIIVERLQREFNVEATFGRPQVAYKETVTRSADGEMKYARQIAGRGQYAHVKIHLSPGNRGSGYVFQNAATGGAIPPAFITPIDAGIKEALTRGVLAGHPIDDVRIELYDGSYHDVDSSEVAFKIAGALAFQDAAAKAGAVVIEPVMHVEVVVPDEYTSAVLEDLSKRRGGLEWQEARGGTQVIHARVPLSNLLGYATDLRSRTRGRGTYSMRLHRYETVDPPYGDGDAFVRAPVRPLRPSGNSGASVREPDGRVL